MKPPFRFENVSNGPYGRIKDDDGIVIADFVHIDDKDAIVAALNAGTKQRYDMLYTSMDDAIPIFERLHLGEKVHVAPGQVEIIDEVVHWLNGEGDCDRIEYVSHRLSDDEYAAFEKRLANFGSVKPEEK